ncbi:phosphatase PAP2 family protein [Gillisia sp. M10.2A]|uniref:Phosphatase PAP2 family protein n=1 Tax=Gillisia lutea TaxID=2909668 RepID=A0ABS9EF74_9FLAO|nr:phosphatase PAP2 family protein [Gillisia lutea]MCF4101524.1 phosphatase PAP2 family protein [Gillisia lutea]
MKAQLIQFVQVIAEFLKRNFKKYNSKLPYILTIILALIIVVIGINLFIELTETLKSKTLATYDASIINYVISYRSPILNKILQFITNIGDFYGYLVVALLSAFFFYFKLKNWSYVGQMILILGVSALSNLALKRFIDRARPMGEHLVSVETLSYPSGHAMSAISFYGFLIYLCYRLKMNRWLKFSLISIFVLLIAAIGISRIYLGVHFPSDIAGGFIAGLIWITFCVLMFNVVDLFKRRTNNAEISDISNKMN